MIAEGRPGIDVLSAASPHLERRLRGWSEARTNEERKRFAREKVRDFVQKD
jgi:hypothetical protein